MIEQTLLPGAYDARFDEERSRELERDLTPRGVVEQLFGVLRQCPRFLKKPPRRILDPSAGAGIYAAVAHETWPDAEIVTVEVAIEEEEHLRRLAKRRGLHFTARFQAFAQTCPNRFDLAATNPPFGQAREFVDLARTLLEPDGMLVLTLPSRFGQKSEDEVTWMFSRDESDSSWTRWLNIPNEEMRISGPIAFRGGSSAAFDTYSHFAWGPRPELRPAGDPPSWDLSQLWPLPGAARRWTKRPGEETST